MRHTPLCLLVPFVLACGLFGPGQPTILVEGTVTRADDGSPIPGMSVVVWQSGATLGELTVASVTTDGSGRYSLSFETERGCSTYLLFTRDRTLRFYPQHFDNAAGIQCTDEVQTFDFQLERNPDF